MASKEKNNAKKKLQKSYFDVLGLCCSSEVPLIENILKPLDGIKEVSVIVPSRTVIVVHDSMVISQLQIVKALNEARLEANIRVCGDELKHQKRWPSPPAIVSGLLLLLSFLKYAHHPFHPFQYFALGAVAAGVFPIVLKAIASVRNLRLDINILMIMAVVGTTAMGDYVEAGTIVFLFSIAEWLESRASHKASAVMSSLMNIAPQKAVIAETGEVVDADEVEMNTVLAVKAGEVIPMDGIVVDGNCEVDEKTLTGESFPVPKQRDSTVWAGTINLNGYISVKTTALAEDCVVAKMAKLVEEAQNSKTSTQRLIDQFAKYYTPAVVVISTLLAVIPVALRVHNQKHWFHFALVMLVSACPCALILSTPVATFCAYTKAATSGLLIKGGDYLETLAKIKIMGFDKTGTITKGEFVVTNFKSLCDDVDLNTLIYWVTSVESKSSHPMAAAIVNYGRSLLIEPKPENVTEFENFPGEGIHGRIDERDLYIGNRKIALRAGSETVPALLGDTHGKTAGYIYSGSTPIGFFSLSDACRSGVQEAIGKLKLLGIRTAMLTGDSQAAAMQAQEQLGHSLELVHAELLPEDKVKIIAEFKKKGPTAMIGDGINDAPALATADIGISMGISGSALASETGDIILMSNDIGKIPEAIKLARRSHKKVIENVILAVTTKAAIIGLALAGHPLVWAAVLADVGTCLLVILNSMLLLREGNRHRGKCCRSSSQPGVHKNGCHAPNGKSSHHHHHHSHQHCCSEKIKEVSHTEKFTSHQCASKCKSSPSNSSLVGNSKYDNVTGSQEKCKGIVEFHEPDHCHHGGCESKHGVVSHDIRNQGCSDSHDLILAVDDKCENSSNSHGTCLDGHKCQVTLHCHYRKCDMGTHDEASPSSPCHFSTLKECHGDHHLIDGCEYKKDQVHHKIMRCNHNSQHQNPVPHSVFKKHGADHTFIDIFLDNEHIDSASMPACTSVKDKDKGSCCKECPEISKKFPVGHACASSIENKIDPCCRSGSCSKESVGSPTAHACVSFDKREIGGCCKNYMRECCGKHGHLRAGFGGGGLSKIITE